MGLFLGPHVAVALSRAVLLVGSLLARSSFDFIEAGCWLDRDFQKFGPFLGLLLMRILVYWGSFLSPLFPPRIKQSVPLKGGIF